MLDALLEAIRRKNEARLEELRSSWADMRDAVMQGGEEQLQMTPAERAAMSIWLSTPPERHRADTAIVQPVPTAVRESGHRHQEQIRSMFRMLGHPELLDSVRGHLEDGDYSRLTDWLGVADLDWAELLRRVASFDWETRVALVGGYAASISGMLARIPGDPLEASLQVIANDDSFVLLRPDHMVIPLDSTARSMASWGGVSAPDCAVLAVAVTFALPACPAVLPNVEFTIGPDACRFRSLLAQELRGRPS